MKKYVLLTGASTGIGEATARMLDKEGFYVFAGVRKASDGEKLKAAASPRLMPVILDVTQPQQIADSFAYIKGICGAEGLAAVINNAGINYSAPFEFSDTSKVRNLMEVNVFGLIQVSQTFLPLLQDYAIASGEKAKLINIGSIGSAIGIPWEFSYHTAKFAVLGLSQSLRFELEPLGIDVCCVMPGGIKTPFFAKSADSSAEAKAAISGRNEAYYTRNISQMWETAVQFEKMASPPEKVGKTLLHILRARRTRLKYLVGTDAKVIHSLVWLGLSGMLKGVFVRP